MYNAGAQKTPFTHTGPPKPEVPVPDTPPYRAHIGNISYDLTEDAVEAFLGHHRVVEILITRYREDGRAKSCFVEFVEREDLEKALELDGRDLMGRRARVEVAMARQRRDGADGGGRGVGRGRGRGGRGDRGDRFGLPPRKEAWEPPTMPSEESRAARPRLNLKPRSQKVGEVDAAQTGGSSNIFGQAKPIDTTAKLQALELKDEKAKEDKAAATEKAAATDRLNEGREGKEKAKPAKSPPVLKAEKANPTKLANPFDLLGEE